MRWIGAVGVVAVLGVGAAAGPPIVAPIDVVSATSAASTASGALAGPPVPVPAYRAPLDGSLTVLTPFRPPATRYGPGHRGVDLAAAVGHAGAVRRRRPGGLRGVAGRPWSDVGTAPGWAADHV